MMCKKVVGIVGSYRKGRVIDTAVTEILNGAESRGAETVKIYLTEKQIEFCNNCRSCMQEPKSLCRLFGLKTNRCWQRLMRQLSFLTSFLKSNWIFCEMAHTTVRFTTRYDRM